MNKITLLLLLSSFAGIGVTWTQPRIQIADGQKFTVSCVSAEEVVPRRKFKVKFILLDHSAADVDIEMQVGLNATVSNPTIPATPPPTGTPKITFKPDEFPKTSGDKPKTVEKEVNIELSTTLIDKDEKVYLYIKDKEKMGVLELNISCDKKKVVETRAQQPVGGIVPVTEVNVANQNTTIQPGSIISPIITPTQAPLIANKPICECISVARGKEIPIAPHISYKENTPATENRTINFQISLKKGCAIPADTLVRIKLVTVNTTDSKPELTAIAFPLKKKDWPDSTTNEAKLITFTTSIRLSKVDSFTSDKIYYIALDNCTDTDDRQIVRETDKSGYNPNKPFWVELGSNFDLIDEIRPNNLFFGVFMYEREVKKITYNWLKKKRELNFSIFGGVYNSRSIAEETSTRFSPLVYFNPNKSLRPIDTSAAMRNVFWAYADSGKIKATNSVRNVGLFFSPQLRLTDESADKDGLHIFTSLWIEMIWQRFNTSYDFSEMKLYDSFPVRHASDSFKQVKIRPQPEIEDIRSHYFGIGFPIYFKEGELNLYFSPVFGKTNQRLSAKENIISAEPFTNPFYNPAGAPIPYGLNQKNVLSVLEVPEKRWNWFYLFQFRLNEEHYGIAFTGEVRGIFQKYYKPVISLALSKKFDLNKLLNFGLKNQ